MGGVFEALPCRSHRQAGPLHGMGLQVLQGIGGGPTGRGGGGGGGGVNNFGMGGKGWVRGKEARSGSACSRRFSAGSRGELQDLPCVGEQCEAQAIQSPLLRWV